jgi:hypothetical protein
MESEQDITLQTEGRLLVFLVKKGLTYQRNPKSTRYMVAFKYIVLGPPNDPPPGWSNLQQFTAVDQQCPDYGTVIGNSELVRPFGCINCFTVNDMSAKTVLPGKLYGVVIQAYPLIQLYFQLRGGPSGTVVTPGFGLFGLGHKRLEYTYVLVDPDWDGEWSTGLMTWQSASIMQLAIEYAPPRDYGDGVPTSKLIFTLEGALVQHMRSDAEADAPAPGQPTDDWRCYLHPEKRRYRFAGAEHAVIPPV